jgi:hypothetical protein
MSLDCHYAFDDASQDPRPLQALTPGERKSPVIPVHEDSSVEDVGRWLRGLDQSRGAEECAQKFEQEDIDGQVFLKHFTSVTFEKFWEPLTTRDEPDGVSPSISFF